MEGCSPQEFSDPAEAPYWLLETLIETETATRAREQRGKDATKAKKALKNLDPSKCTAYKAWLEIGMCLHSAGEDLLQTWISFSSKMVILTKKSTRRNGKHSTLTGD